jgi:hypothetical protein
VPRLQRADPGAPALVRGLLVSFSAQLYRDPDSGRMKWAVIHLATRVWYFLPEGRRGKAAAMQMAHGMNQLRVLRESTTVMEAPQ